jgi:hypothetical protein
MIKKQFAAERASRGALDSPDVLPICCAPITASKEPGPHRLWFTT